MGNHRQLIAIVDTINEKHSIFCDLIDIVINSDLVMCIQ